MRKNRRIINSFNHNFERITNDSYKSLLTEKILIFQNVKILIMSIANKNKNNYFYRYIFLKKFKSR